MSEIFTIVVLPDSQRYVEDGFRDKRLHCFEKQIQWILDNKNEYNIRFVTHVGDIVHHRDSITERTAFFECIQQLNGRVPFGFCGGNHDLLFGEQAESVVLNRGKDVFLEEYTHPEILKLQDEYICTFRKEAHWINDCNHGYSNAQMFSVFGKKYMVIHLEYGPSDDTVEWAASLLLKHRDIPTFLTTHMFITPEEEQGITKRDSRLSTYQSNMVGEGDNAGFDIWNKLIVPYENVHCVLCGHYADERYMLLDTGTRKVAALQSDYELEKPYYGNGWMRLLRIDPSNKTMKVETYSPVLNEYKSGEKSCFVI